VKAKNQDIQLSQDFVSNLWNTVQGLLANTTDFGSTSVNSLLNCAISRAQNLVRSEEQFCFANIVNIFFRKPSNSVVG